MQTKNARLIHIVAIVIVVLISIISFAILPDRIGIQIGIDGEFTNTAPKWMGLSIPIAVSIIGYLRGTTKDNFISQKEMSSFFIQVVAIVVAIATLVINYK
ncbi:MAG: hypothetical protein RR620_02345 [Clostridium sp.]